MVYTHYQPSHYFPSHKIVPTEDDTYFRFGRVQGHVHDMAAAMLDGVSGHAGLFSNVDDLAIFFQMLLNHGTYDGKRIFQPSTIREFTTRHPKDKDRKSTRLNSSHVAITSHLRLSFPTRRSSDLSVGYRVMSMIWQQPCWMESVVMPACFPM